MTIKKNETITCVQLTDGLTVGRLYKAVSPSGRYNFLDHQEFVDVTDDLGVVSEFGTEVFGR